MDEFKIILIALTVVFSIARAIKKLVDRSEGAPPVDAFDDHPEPDDVLPPAPAARATYLEGKSAAREAAYAEGGRMKAKTIAPEPAATPAEESLANDFDLRQAVIYSEILKPKFDE